jgi:hypothetical protein
MARSFRDRLLTPPVARAITSPLGILLAGAGASVGIVAGLPLAGAAAIAAAAWGARVAVAVPRDGRDARHIDPFALQDPWRTFVRNAQTARRKFDEAVRNARRGPLRDRLSEIAARLDDGVQECWRIAQQGQVLVDARRQLDTADAARDLARLQAEGARAGAAHDQTVEALHAQLESAQRMDRTITDARERLQLLDARMDEAVARAIELSVQAGDVDLGGLTSDVDGLVGDMEALRQGLEEADRAAPGTATA